MTAPRPLQLFAAENLDRKSGAITTQLSGALANSET